MAKVDKIAAKMVDRIMADAPMVTKSAGARAQLTATVMPAAIVVRELEKAVARYGKSLDRLTARLASMTQQISGLHPVPGASEVERGWRRFDGESDVVGLVKQAAPKTMNGYHSPDVGVAQAPPPGWHPEAD